MMPGFDTGQLATLACVIEATIPKPGNVHRGADFEDVTFLDFMTSAVAIAPAMQNATKNGVGATVLAATRDTHATVKTNTNLGIVLLLSPLAAATDYDALQESTQVVLDQMTPTDTALTYEAIRLAKPGGLGKTDSADVNEEPPQSLVEAMQLAAGRDLVARQYANGYQQVFEFVLPRIVQSLDSGLSLTHTVIQTHLRVMSEFPDSLIQRKLGEKVAEQSASRAAAVLDAGDPGDATYESALADFDFWLRSDGHRRNPGTTADLIAASLFAGLLNGSLRPPFAF
jgi:triphosphoribosyl-dephospho-CoA synthase